MPSLFAELERLVSAAVDETYAEATRIEPKAKSQYFAGSADSERTPITLVGVCDFDPVTLVAQDTGKYDGMRPAVAGDKLHVSYDEALFPTWRPQAGDVIVLTERADEPSLRISRVDRDRFGRLVCVCTPME
jgi:hypothetical protein